MANQLLPWPENKARLREKNHQIISTCYINKVFARFYFNKAHFINIPMKKSAHF